jgi:hypothetical protein
VPVKITQLPITFVFSMSDGYRSTDSPWTDSRQPEALNTRMPALGYSAAGMTVTLVIDTIDFAPGYVTTMEERAGMPKTEECIRSSACAPGDMSR